MDGSLVTLGRQLKDLQSTFLTPRVTNSWERVQCDSITEEENRETLKDLTPPAIPILEAFDRKVKVEVQP
jgi:hypothetical protein